MAEVKADKSAENCIGYNGGCDGMLPGEEHSSNCPFKGTFGPPQSDFERGRLSGLEEAARAAEDYSIEPSACGCSEGIAAAIRALAQQGQPTYIVFSQGGNSGTMPTGMGSSVSESICPICRVSLRHGSEPRHRGSKACKDRMKQVRMAEIGKCGELPSKDSICREMFDCEYSALTDSIEIGIVDQRFKQLAAQPVKNNDTNTQSLCHDHKQVMCGICNKVADGHSHILSGAECGTDYDIKYTCNPVDPNLPVDDSLHEESCPCYGAKYPEGFTCRCGVAAQPVKGEEKLTPHWTAKSIDDFAYRVTSDFIAQLEVKIENEPIERQELALRLGVTPGRVSQVLNNPGNPTIKRCVQYALGLGSKVAIVVYEDNDPNNEFGPINSDVFNQCWRRMGCPRAAYQPKKGDDSTVYPTNDAR